MEFLRIVRIMPFFDPATGFGGVVTQAREVCRLLAERGHEVRVVTTDMGQGPEIERDRWLPKDGYRVLYARTLPWHRVVPYRTQGILRPLEEALRGADLLNMNVGLTLLNAMGRRLAKRQGVPYVYNAEGALCPVRLRIKAFRKAFFLRLVERPLLRDAAAVQALTGKDAEDLRAQGTPPERIHLIPNGVRRHGGGVRGDPAAFRRRWNLPPGSRILLFLGRLHAIKGLDLLVEVFIRVAGEVPDLHLLLAGRDEDGTRKRLEARVQRAGLPGRVHFCGHLEDDGKAGALAAAEVFALTSYTEGLPMAVLEACSHGLPCLLTTHCNLGEVEEYGAGSVREAEPEPLSEALRRMLGQESLRRRMSENARRMVAERFELETVVGKLEALYLAVAGKGGGRA